MIRARVHHVSGVGKAAFGLVCLVAWAAAGAGTEEGAGIELLRNGDMEQGDPAHGPAAWHRRAVIPDGVELFWSTEAASGNRSLGIRSRYTADRPWFWWEQLVNLRKASVLDVRAGVKSRRLTRSAAIVFRFRGPAGPVARALHVLLPPDTAGGWKDIHRRVSAPPGATAVLVQFTMHGAGEILLDDFHMTARFRPRHQTFEQARSVPALRISQPLRIDGDLSDWPETPVMHVRRARALTNAEAVVEQTGESRGRTDLSFTFRLTWDERNLYLGVTVKDDVRVLQNPYWRGDSIQFAIDTEWRRRPSGYGPGDFAFGVIAPERAGPVRTIVERRPAGAGITPGAVAASGAVQPDGYVVELALPWRALAPSVPSHNSIMGFTILVNDSDGGPRKWAEWTPGIAMRKSPAQYGTLLFFVKDAPVVWAAPPIGPVTDARPAVVTACVGTLRREVSDRLRFQLRGPGAAAPMVTLERPVTARRGVTCVPFVTEPSALRPGDAELRLAFAGASWRRAVRIDGLRRVIAEVQERVRRLKTKVRRLQAAVAAARNRKLDVALPDASCVTAEYFLRWIPGDVSREGYERLALREARRLEPILDRALQEIADIRAHPEAHPARPAPDIRRARLRGGNWYVGDRPVFFIGLNQLPLEVLPDLPRFGGNFVTIGGGAAAWTLPRGPEPDTGALRRAVVAHAVRASRFPVLINVLFGHRMPKWAVTKYPDILAADGHFMDYDIDHPVARRLTCTAMEAAARALRDVPGVISYDVWNEAGYWKVSDRGRERFRRAMQEKYGTIEALNREWGTRFDDFSAVTPLRDPERYPAAYFDWVKWNDARVAEFAREMRDAVRRGDPEGLTTMKISNEAVVMGSRSLTFRKRRISAHGQGIDRWKLSRIFDLQGCDTRPTLLSPDYAFAWRYPGMAYDLQRSMAPDKPIDDSEWHAVQTVYFTDEDQPAAFIDAALWFSYLHGMDMNITWWWSRTANGDPKAQWFRGSLLTQPQLLDAWARNNIMVQRFAAEIAAFQSRRPRVRLLFSKPSAVLDIHYLDVLFDAYEALSWFGVPIGFVTEEMLTGAPPAMDLLILPAARHASAGVPEAVRALAGRGVRVVSIGKGCLSLTEHGKPRAAPVHLPGAVWPDASDLTRWRDVLGAAGVLPPVRCVRPGTFHSKPVGFRTLGYGDRRLIWVLGLGKKPAVVELRDAAGRVVSARSLLDGRLWNGGERGIAPYEFDLLEVVP